MSGRTWTVVGGLREHFTLSEGNTISAMGNDVFYTLRGVSFVLPIVVLCCLISRLVDGDLNHSHVPFCIVNYMVYTTIVIVYAVLRCGNAFFAACRRSNMEHMDLTRRLHGVPLSFFKGGSLTSLASSVVGSYTILRRDRSRFIRPLVNSVVSAILVTISLLFFGFHVTLTTV